MRQPLEFWAGVECTVNRVGDRYLDQLARIGHDSRPGDFERFAELGIDALRFPALWERMAPRAPEEIDWRWTDEALPRLRRLGIRPIVGFVHHGAGPRWADVAGGGFAAGLAEFAGRFADRYPWVDAYTPVNEPLTTARFSGLYGFWYPHGRSAAVFLDLLLTECEATARAMRAIRGVNPVARLVQTDDLGKTSSTPAMRYQADFDNERRWLGFDMLFARVDAAHPLWQWMTALIDAATLSERLGRCRCSPDVIGINHYVTSNRHLDEDPAAYPAWAYGGNGRHRYADVEAVRVAHAPPLDVGALIGEAWRRYSCPIAVTEAHMGCTRDEQARWLLEVWSAAVDAKERGADVRAVTAWALLGAYDWDSLVTRDAGRYEPGVFDMRGGAPRPTFLCDVVRDLAAGVIPEHPALASPGWWHRAERVVYGDPGSLRTTEAFRGRGRAARREVLIAGRNGTLGRAFARVCERRGLACQLLDRRALDIADPASVERVMDAMRPWAVINAAGYCRVDDAETHEAACLRSNTVGPRNLALACAARALPMVTFSSDLVFDGRARTPYRETDRVLPLNFYGRSKAQAEAEVLACHPGALVVRTSAFFGPWDEHNFATRALRSIASRRAWHAASDLTVSPTYLPDLIDVCLDLVLDGASGLWHLANQGAVSWAEFACKAAAIRGYDCSAVIPVPWTQLGWQAERPAFSVLGSERAGTTMPPLDEALERYARECRVA